MSDTAFQTQYYQEWIAGFEKRESLSRKTTTTKVQIKGDKGVFLVADSGNASAVTRGANGDIPTRSPNKNQYTVTLTEWHDLPESTDFDVFASQGDVKQILQQTSMAVVSRKIDSDIHKALATGTVTWGPTATATLELVGKARTKLLNAFAIQDEQPFALITPAFHAYLMKLPEFTSADFIRTKPFEGVNASAAFNWWGINWIVDAGLPGTGSVLSSCFMYARAAIGSAFDKERLVTLVGYDEKNAKSWARTSIYTGSKVLQNSGIIQMPHDDSAYS